jgi:hypothetical protein
MPSGQLRLSAGRFQPWNFATTGKAENGVTAVARNAFWPAVSAPVFRRPLARLRR